MSIKIKSLQDGARSAQGTVVIVDVFRACTTIPILLYNGAEKIIPVRTVKEAEPYRSRGYILIGEDEHGTEHDIFDYNNSPSQVYKADFTGKNIVFRSNNAAQAILDAKQAEDIILASFVNLDACARYLVNLHPKDITLVPLGRLGKKSIEDEMCAEALKHLLEGRKYTFSGAKEKLNNSETAVLVRDILKKPEDIEISLTMDSYPVVPKVYCEDSRRLIKKAKV